MAFYDKMTLGAEYLYVDLGSSSFTTTSDTLNGIATCAPAACRLDIKSSHGDQILRLKSNIKM